MSSAKKNNLDSGKGESHGNGDQPHTQRVAPYPIALELWLTEGQTPKWTGQIVKLTEVGFLMKVDSIKFYKVGEVVHLEFRLPVVSRQIRCQGKVVKTYDAMQSGTAQGVTKLYTVEVHFKNQIEAEKQAILNYLVQSGQKKY